MPILRAYSSMESSHLLRERANVEEADREEDQDEQDHKAEIDDPCCSVEGDRFVHGCGHLGGQSKPTSYKHASDVVCFGRISHSRAILNGSPGDHALSST